MSGVRELRVAPIQIMLPKGPATVAGWSDGLFCLDFRVCDDGSQYRTLWVVTHALAQRAVGALLDLPLDVAFEFVDWLHGLGDWQFSDPSEAKRRFPDLPAQALNQGWPLVGVDKVNILPTFTRLRAAGSVQ
jgi:hypothetical protein